MDRVVNYSSFALHLVVGVCFSGLVFAWFNNLYIFAIMQEKTYNLCSCAMAGSVGNAAGKHKKTR